MRVSSMNMKAEHAGAAVLTTLFTAQPVTLANTTEEITIKELSAILSPFGRGCLILLDLSRDAGATWATIQQLWLEAQGKEVLRSPILSRESATDQTRIRVRFNMDTAGALQVNVRGFKQGLPFDNFVYA